MFELIPAARNPRSRAIVARFNQAYVEGDYALAENMALMVENNLPGGGLATYLRALTAAAQGRYGEARQLLVTFDFSGQMDDLHEAVLWVTLLLDYAAGDWIAFEHNCVHYAQGSVVDGCVCLYQARSFFLNAIRALREQNYSIAQTSLLRVRGYRPIAPLLVTWADLGQIEVQLRQGDGLTAQFDLQTLARDLGEARPLIGWQLFFPLCCRLAQQQGLKWQDSSPLPTTHHLRMQVLPETTDCRLEVLGPGRLLWQGHEVMPFRQHIEARQVVAYLALKSEGATGYELLSDLWPERLHNESQANALAQLFQQMQTWTPEPLVIYDRGIYHVRPDLWIDALEYAQRYEEARSSREMSLLQEVQKLYVAPFLHGISGLWAEEQRARYQLMQSWLLWRLSELARAENDFETAQHLLEQSVDINYTFDRGMNDLMRLLEERGLRTEALRRFENYRRKIWQIYHVQPSPHLLELAERLASDERQITGAFSLNDLRRAVRSTAPMMPQSQRR